MTDEMSAREDGTIPPKIKRKTAYKMAIDALRRDRALISGDAILHDGGIRTPYTIRCWKNRARINSAIKLLSEEGGLG